MSRHTIPGSPPAGPLHVTDADLEAMLAHNVAAEHDRGWAHVTLIHGDVETADEADRLELLRRFAGDTGGLVATRGGNDYTTWIFRGPQALALQAAMIGRVAGLALGWWQWSTDPLPRFGR